MIAPNIQYNRCSDQIRVIKFARKGKKYNHFKIIEVINWTNANYDGSFHNAMDLSISDSNLPKCNGSSNIDLISPCNGSNLEMKY